MVAAMVVIGLHLSRCWKANYGCAQTTYGWTS